jgi:zinc transport system substrate-binding protein
VLANGLPGCSKSTPVWQNRGAPDGPRVVVTIPALDSFVRNVGGERVGIICLCTSKGPHHYEYNPTDAMVLRDANLFFAIGLTLDDKFADQMQDESHNAGLRYLKLGERLPKKLLLKGEEHEEGKDEKGHDHEHEHGEYDPHVWLGIPQAIALVEMIRDELKRVDAGHAEEYEKNATDYIQALQKLHADGKEKLKDKKDRKIIAFHESLAYFANSFGVEIVDAIERAPGEEPLPGHLAKLVEKCKASHVRVIAIEPQYPRGSSAEVLKKDVKDIELVVVDPLETADQPDLREDQRELKSKDWYEKKMRQNVENLAKNLP